MIHVNSEIEAYLDVRFLTPNFIFSTPNFAGFGTHIVDTYTQEAIFEVQAAFGPRGACPGWT